MNKQVFKKIQVNLTEIISSSTVHGISSTFRVKRFFMQIVWLFSFLLGTGVCLWFIVQTFQQYFDYEVITTVRVINEIPSEFPMITFCNLNPLTTADGYSFGNILVKQVGFLTMDDLPYSMLDNILSRLKTVVSNLEDEKKRNWGSSYNRMFLKCTFSNKTCDESDFTWIYNSNYGNCYAFNSIKENKSAKVSYISGIQYGLSVELNVGMYSNWEKFYDSFGALLMISNRTLKSINSKEIIVSPGSETNLVIERTFVEQKPSPYSDCEFNTLTSAYDSVLYRSIIKANYSYTQQDCFYQCLQLKIENTCLCYNPDYLPINLNYSCIDINNTTKGFSNLNCSDFVINSFFTDSIGECSSFCPLECNKVLFFYQSSSINSLSESRAKLDYFNNSVLIDLYSNVTIDIVKKSVVKLNIFYEDLHYTEITESESMTVFSLFSNVGGTLGLFIGASLLSFIELFELIYEIIITYIEHSKVPSNVSFMTKVPKV